MPFGNHKGPLDMGSRTGRGAGFCAGYNQPGYVSAPGRMTGVRRGFGVRGGRCGMRGWRMGYQIQEDTATEKSYLTEQISAMEETIKQMKNRLNDIEENK